MSLRIIGPNYRLSNGQIVYVDILPSQKTSTNNAKFVKATSGKIKTFLVCRCYQKNICLILRMTLMNEKITYNKIVQ